MDKFGENSWNMTSYLSMARMDDPERDCDCSSGSNGGLCPHFWILFIATCAEGLINIKDWKLTYFPDTIILARLRDEGAQSEGSNKD